MPILLDAKPLPTPLAENSTLADALSLVQTHLPRGAVIVKVELDGTVVEGTALTLARSAPVAGRNLAVSSADQKQLALAMIGKLAALIQWLAPQHAQIAAMFEKGQAADALTKLSGILSAWHQIQQSYTSLLTMLNIRVQDLPVREINADVVMTEFRNQLLEVQTALQNKDYVLLADVLQYEMEGVTANWTAVLEATLARVAPEGL